jgi:WD40 repeat protein
MKVSELLCVLVASAVVLTLSGCKDELGTQMAWSPDGKKLAVTADDGLHLFDIDKGPIAAAVPDTRLAAWLPDSRSLILARAIKPLSPDNYLELFSPQERKQVVASAQSLKHTFKGWSNAEFNKDHPELEKLPFFRQAFTYLLVHDPEDMKPKFGKDWETVLQEAGPVAYNLQTYTLTPEKLLAGLIIRKSQFSTWDLNVSPDGTKALITERLENPDNTQTTYRLIVVRTGDGKELVVSQRVARYADWSPDGKSVYCLEQLVSTDHPWDGRILSYKVCDDHGDLLSKVVDPDEVAHVFCTNESQIRCAKDGTILFTCTENVVPAKAGDLSRQNKLFAINKEKLLAGMVAHSLAEDLGNISSFAISPDGQCAALQSQLKGVVLAPVSKGVYFAPTGRTWMVSDKIDPQWRSNNELCFPVKVIIGNEPSRRYELVLWNSGPLASSKEPREKIISKQWPTESLRWLESEE